MLLNEWLYCNMAGIWGEDGNMIDWLVDWWCTKEIAIAAEHLLQAGDLQTDADNM